jgi:hypothetical protein
MRASSWRSSLRIFGGSGSQVRVLNTTIQQTIQQKEEFYELAD